MIKPEHVIRMKLSKRGRDSLGVVLDKRFCQLHSLKSGDQVEVFQHPKERNVFCVRVPARPRPSGPRRSPAKSG